MSPSRRRAAALAAMVAAAFFLRAWGLGTPPEPTGDEGIHVPSARAYLETGHTNPTTWPYPPLNSVLLRASIELFGDDPWGWRLRNALFGAAAVVLLVLLGGSLYPERPEVGWIAGLVLAADPLHIVISRSTFEEIPATTFFLLCVWLAVLHVRSARCVPLGAALALGLSLATKPYYLLAGPLVAGAIVVSRLRTGRSAASAAAALTFVVVPVAVIVAAYLPWFARGYRLTELFGLQLDAAREILSRRDAFYMQLDVLEAGGSKWTWFTSLHAFGFPVGAARTGWGRFVVFTGNPLTWLLVLPSVAYVLSRGWRERIPGDVAVAALFVASYVPILLAARPLFFYSSLAVFPFACLAVARAAALVRERWPAAGLGWAGAATACALALYPLAAAKAVPMSIYGPLLRWVTVFGPVG